MTEIIRSPDCGNSPKNLFAQETAIALETGDGAFLSRSVAEEATWRIVGGGEADGKPALLERAGAVDLPGSAVLRIIHVMTHGRVGAVNGALETPDGRTRSFCHVYEFTGARGSAIRSITSYIIEG